MEITLANHIYFLFLKHLTLISGVGLMYYITHKMRALFIQKKSWQWFNIIWFLILTTVGIWLTLCLFKDAYCFSMFIANLLQNYPIIRGFWLMWKYKFFIYSCIIFTLVHCWHMLKFFWNDKNPVWFTYLCNFCSGVITIYCCINETDSKSLDMTGFPTPSILIDPYMFAVKNLLILLLLCIWLYIMYCNLKHKVIPFIDMSLLEFYYFISLLLTLCGIFIIFYDIDQILVFWKLKGIFYGYYGDLKIYIYMGMITFYIISRYLYEGRPERIILFRSYDVDEDREIIIAIYVTSWIMFINSLIFLDFLYLILLC